jgi:hypothetical protein
MRASVFCTSSVLHSNQKTIKNAANRLDAPGKRAKDVGTEVFLRRVSAGWRYFRFCMAIAGLKRP